VYVTINEYFMVKYLFVLRDFPLHFFRLYHLPILLFLHLLH
jgi:hypothetical protein